MCTHNRMTSEEAIQLQIYNKQHKYCLFLFKTEYSFLIRSHMFSFRANTYSDPVVKQYTPTIQHGKNQIWEFSVHFKDTPTVYICLFEHFYI